VINYVYDSLYRLTAADYSSGEYFHYSYDPVGNRLTEQTQGGTNTYAYDAANRLTSVDGVPFSWDDNGNLLSDGVSTYSYDHANRLTSAVRGVNAYSFAYNGLGDRLRQTLNGAPTSYTLDINTGLTQVLADGTNTYLYGGSRIGEQQPGGWQYHLGDALGSVRQLTSATGTVTLAQSYEPFGSTLTYAGLASTVFKFSGEQTDETGLSHLRTRYYASASGRFLSRDLWDGNPRQPLTLNPFLYALDNPATYVDPSGRVVSPTGAQTCALYFFSNGLLPSPTTSAQALVDLCGNFYSQGFWREFILPAGIGNYDCEVMGQSPWVKPTTAAGLFGDFICERGPDHVHFDGRDKLTHKLAHSLLLHRLRMEFYDSGPLGPREERLGSILDYLAEWRDLKNESGFPIAQVLGSIDISVGWAAGGRVRFMVHNRMDLASGTHLIGRFPPEGQGRNPLSLEEVITVNPALKSQLAWWVLATHTDPSRGRIVSILRPRTRDLTGPGMGGGNFEQTFVWTERNVACDVSDKPWPAYLALLEIGAGH
jgi:RHS repeat-associated protein